jgi:hypothetical protein
LSNTEESRAGLGDEPFSWYEGGDGKVFISWRGSRVKVLKGHKASSFLQRLTALDAAGQQIALAKETGNFKRGNER